MSHESLPCGTNSRDSGVSGEEGDNVSVCTKVAVFNKSGSFSGVVPVYCNAVEGFVVF